MDGQSYLLLANILIWLGVGGYIVFIARGQERLRKRLDQVEAMLDE